MTTLDERLSHDDLFDPRELSLGEIRTLTGRACERAALWIVKKWIDESATLNDQKISGTNEKGNGDLIIPDIKLSSGWLEVKSVSRGSSLVFRMDQHAGIEARGDVRYMILVHPRKLTEIAGTASRLIQAALNHSIVYIVDPVELHRLCEKFGKKRRATKQRGKYKSKVSKRGWDTYDWLQVSWSYLPILLKLESTQVFAAQVGSIPKVIGSLSDQEMQEFVNVI